MIRLRTLTFSVLFVFLAACAATTDSVKREGVNAGTISSPELSLDFPESEFLTAVGIGQSEMEARRLAKVELSNIFEAKVTSDVSSSVKSVTGPDSEQRVTRKGEQSVRVVSDLELKGVQIGKVWYDDSQKSHYALAVLDRGQAKENWMKEILDIDGRAEAVIEAAKSQKSALTQLQNFKKVRQLWLQREVLASRLRVLGYRNISGSPYDIKGVFKQMHKIKSDLLIYVDAGSGNYGRIATSEISEMLAGSGFALSEDKKGSNIFITGAVEVESVDLGSRGMEFARANAVLSIVDLSTGLTAGEITENKRSGHLKFSEAANKAVRKVSKALSRKLAAYFSD